MPWAGVDFMSYEIGQKNYKFNDGPQVVPIIAQFSGSDHNHEPTRIVYSTLVHEVRGPSM